MDNFCYPSAGGSGGKPCQQNEAKMNLLSNSGVPLVLSTPPSPASLVFTPMPARKSSSLNCKAKMTPDHRCEATDSDSDWEDIENEQDLYPTLELNSEDWADRFTNSIRTYHGVDH